MPLSHTTSYIQILTYQPFTNLLPILSLTLRTLTYALKTPLITLQLHVNNRYHILFGVPQIPRSMHHR